MQSPTIDMHDIHYQSLLAEAYSTAVSTILQNLYLLLPIVGDIRPSTWRVIPAIATATVVYDTSQAASSTPALIPPPCPAVPVLQSMATAISAISRCPEAVQSLKAAQRSTAQHLSAWRAIDASPPAVGALMSECPPQITAVLRTADRACAAMTKALELLPDHLQRDPHLLSAVQRVCSAKVLHTTDQTAAVQRANAGLADCLAAAGALPSVVQDAGAVLHTAAWPFALGWLRATDYCVLADDLIVCLRLASSAVQAALKEVDGSAAVGADDYLPCWMAAVAHAVPARAWTSAALLSADEARAVGSGEASYHMANFLSALAWLGKQGKAALADATRASLSSSAVMSAAPGGPAASPGAQLSSVRSITSGGSSPAPCPERADSPPSTDSAWVQASRLRTAARCNAARAWASQFSPEQLLLQSTKLPRAAVQIPHDTVDELHAFLELGAVRATAAAGFMQPLPLAEQPSVVRSSSAPSPAPQGSKAIGPARHPLAEHIANAQRLLDAGLPGAVAESPEHWPGPGWPAAQPWHGTPGPGPGSLLPAAASEAYIWQAHVQQAMAAAVETARPCWWGLGETASAGTRTPPRFDQPSFSMPHDLSPISQASERSASRAQSPAAHRQGEPWPMHAVQPPMDLASARLEAALQKLHDVTAASRRPFPDARDHGAHSGPSPPSVDSSQRTSRSNTSSTR